MLILPFAILEECFPSVLESYERILKNINQRSALNLQVWKQGMMGKPDGQSISRVFAFVISTEKEDYV